MRSLTPFGRFLFGEAILRGQSRVGEPTVYDRASSLPNLWLHLLSVARPEIRSVQQTGTLLTQGSQRAVPNRSCEIDWPGDIIHEITWLTGFPSWFEIGLRGRRAGRPAASERDWNDAGIDRSRQGGFRRSPDVVHCSLEGNAPLTRKRSCPTLREELVGATRSASRPIKAQPRGTHRVNRQRPKVIERRAKSSRRAQVPACRPPRRAWEWHRPTGPGLNRRRLPRRVRLPVPGPPVPMMRFRSTTW